MTFFDLLGPILTEVCKLIYDSGILTKTQRTSVITLICKNDKEPDNVKNYRPIALLNVDYKLISKSLTARLRHIMERLVQ